MMNRLLFKKMPQCKMYGYPENSLENVQHFVLPLVQVIVHELVRLQPLVGEQPGVHLGHL